MSPREAMELQQQVLRLQTQLTQQQTIVRNAHADKAAAEAAAEQCLAAADTRIELLEDALIVFLDATDGAYDHDEPVDQAGPIAQAADAARKLLGLME